MAFRRTLLLGGSAVLAAVVLTQSIADPAYAATRGRHHHHRHHHRVHHHHHHLLGKSGTYATKPKPVIGPVAPKRAVAPKPTPRPTPTTVAVPAAADTPTAGLAPALTSDAVVDTTAGLAAVDPSPVAAPTTPPPAPAPAAADSTDLPVGDLPGWHQVLAEDFSGSSLPSGWGAYEGHPGGEPDGMWLPSHVTVGSGAMHLNGYQDGGRWVTGGVMNSHAASLQYGKYEMRFRMTKGVGVKYAILLWPHTAEWPIGGEIDFAEDGGSGTRDHTSATMHYGADNSIIQREITGVDFSQWHTVGVEWTPGKLVYTLDGKAWASVDSPNVPTSVMDLAVQTETGTCGERWLGCPDATTPAHVNLDVDWVSVWKRA